MDSEKLGLFIAELRKEKEMTQADLAQILHVSDKAVSRWERGVGLPDINVIEPLADALDVSIVEIMKAERIQAEIPKAEASTAIRDSFLLTKLRRKKKKKLMVSGLLAVLLLSVCMWFGTQIYYYFHPHFQIGYATAHSENVYATMPTLAILRESRFGMSDETKLHIQEWLDKTAEMQVYLGQNYDKPKSILCRVNVSNEQTIITYEGIAKSKDGEMVIVKEEIILDFVLTTDIR